MRQNHPTPGPIVRYVALEQVGTNADHPLPGYLRYDLAPARAFGVIAFDRRDKQHEPGELGVFKDSPGRVDVSVAGCAQTQPVMGVPVADVLKAVILLYVAAGTLEVVTILVKRGRLMASFLTGPEDELYRRRPAVCPEPEEIASSFVVRMLQHPSGEVVQFSLVDQQLEGPGAGLGRAK